MSLGSEEKSDVIAEFRRAEGDTGSPEVQIALLTKHLAVLSDHFKRHPQDRHSQRGLMRIVSKRKSQLSYLKRLDAERYKAALAAFGLRK